MLYESLRKREWFRLRGHFAYLGLCTHMLLWEKEMLFMHEINHTSKTQILACPVTGRAASLVETPDTYFASGLMGAGAVLFPQEGRLLSPCDAVVNFVFPKKYALGLRTPEGLEVVLQVGIGSNQMDSQCFQPLVDCGCQVRQGQELLRFDLEAMRQAGILTATPLVVNRSPQQVHPLTLGNLEAGSALLEVTL